MRKLDTTKPINATFDVAMGRVQIVAGDRAEIVANVRPSDAANPQDVKAARQIAVELVGGVLKVKAPGRPPFRQVRLRRVAVRVGGRRQGQGPPGFHAEGRVSDTKLYAEGCVSDTKLHTRARRHLAGPDGRRGLRHTTQGDVRVGEAVRGSFELTTGAGRGAVAEGVAAGLMASTPVTAACTTT